MPRAIWSGSISFGLVNAPVKMYSAIDEHDLDLHLVHEKDGSRIGYEKVCKKEGKAVPSDEIVKAYEVSDGDLVYLTEEDFKAAGEESYRAIEVLDFVPHDEIDPVKGIAPKGQRVDKQELEMASTLIDRFTSTFDHDKYRDEYTDRLLD